MYQEDRTVEIPEIFIDDEIISLPAKSRKIQKKKMLRPEWKKRQCKVWPDRDYINANIWV